VHAAPDRGKSVWGYERYAEDSEEAKRLDILYELFVTILVYVERYRLTRKYYEWERKEWNSDSFFAAHDVYYS
jgi:hypothetical protein